MNPDQLKEIESLRTEIDNLGPIDPAQVKNIDDWYRVELTYTSNALEGNTLTRQETAQVIEKDISVHGKTLNELLEAKNHAEAFDFITQFTGEIKLGTILDIHSKILQKIDDTNAGKFRTVPVRVSGSSSIMPNPAKVPVLMEEYIRWLTADTSHSVKKSIESHYRFVSIHPFTDGNGRTARLLMNLTLLQANFPLLIIPRESRITYVTSLEKGQTTGDTDDYYNFMYERMIASMKEYIQMVKGR
jgi:Fic family protein